MVLTGIYAVLVPTRFLTLLANFFIVICLLCDNEENFRLCLFKYDAEYAGYYHKEYVLTLVLSLGSVVIEFVGFLCGISMFSELHCLLSIASHTCATVIWSISYIDQWDCSTPYNWYILILCSGLPLIVEFAIFFSFLRRFGLY